MKMKRVFGLMTAAGCALYAASAMGATENVVSNSFEDVAVDASISGQTGWEGYGTVTSATYSASSVGFPTGDAHTKVLAVEGRVTRTATTTASKPATVDMMVQIATPDDALAFPSGTDTAEIQIAVGVETNATLKVYCKDKSGAADWYALGTTPYVVGSWHRVSFTFDYAHNLCQIRVDGEPILTDNGYLTTDTTKMDTAAGSWYTLAKANAGQLASVQVIGSTSIDDLLVRQNTAADATVDSVLPELADKDGTTAAGVPYSWIEQQGITRDTTTAPDGTGMTVIQKYAAGYDVADGKKFGVKTMTMSGTQATITFDSAVLQSGYSYVLATSTDNSSWSETPITISAGEASAGSKTIDLGDAAVKYLKLKVVK